MAHVRPLFLPTPYQDSAEAGRLILRDGTTAHVRVARGEDKGKLFAFFQGLTPEARWRRFFSVGVPSRDFIGTLCDPSKPSEVLTLIVTRYWKGEDKVIATASYQAVHQKTATAEVQHAQSPSSPAPVVRTSDAATGGAAEVAFAVDENFQGKGLGSLLLERLAVLAARHGIVRFWAITQADNRPMIDVFRDSGFQIREKPDGGFIEVELSVTPGEALVNQSDMRDRIATAASLRPFFQPRAVAVVGASRDPFALVDMAVLA